MLRLLGLEVGHRACLINDGMVLSFELRVRIAGTVLCQCVRLAGTVLRQRKVRAALQLLTFCMCQVNSRYRASTCPTNQWRTLSIWIMS